MLIRHLYVQANAYLHFHLNLILKYLRIKQSRKQQIHLYGSTQNVPRSYISEGEYGMRGRGVGGCGVTSQVKQGVHLKCLTRFCAKQREFRQFVKVRLINFFVKFQPNYNIDKDFEFFGCNKQAQKHYKKSLITFTR